MSCHEWELNRMEGAFLNSSRVEITVRLESTAAWVVNQARNEELAGAGVVGSGVWRFSANPNGVASYSPRLPYSATLRRRIAIRFPTPTGLRLSAPKDDQRRDEPVL